jgi:hypothetical protein
MAIPYNRLQLIQRIRKHVNDGFPNDSFATSDNEISLYIDTSIAYQIKGLAYENAKVDGTLVVPEGFLMTSQLTGLKQDLNTGYWTVALPQPPLSLPLGYSITQVYFVNRQSKRQNAYPLKVKRAAYRDNMPKPQGVLYQVENGTLILQATNNFPLSEQTCFVQMPINRATDLSAPMNLPDDVINNVFNDVVMQLTKRYAEPKDIIKDDIGAGNNTQKNP